MDNRTDGGTRIPDTRVSGGAQIEGQGIGFSVAHPSRKKCPDGYYWVSSYYRGTYPFGYSVAGHCRKAGAKEQMQQEVLEEELREKQQKENFKMQKKEARFEEKQARRDNRK